MYHRATIQAYHTVPRSHGPSESLHSLKYHSLKYLSVCSTDSIYIIYESAHKNFILSIYKSHPTILVQCERDVWHRATIEAHDIQLKHIRYNWSTWHSPIGPQGPVASLNYLCVSRTLSIQVCIYKCHPMSPTLCIYCRQLHWSSAKEKSTIERQFKHITRPHDSIALEQPQLYKSSTLYMSTKCMCQDTN